MRMALVFGAFVALAGCSYGSDKFAEDYEEAFCAFDASCANPIYASRSVCVTDLQGDKDTDCTYDEDQAKACIDALEGLTCEGALSNFPAACNVACY